MAVGCRGRCFRIRTDDGWVFDPKAELTFIGICPTCYAREKSAQKRAYIRMLRESVRRRTTPGALDHLKVDDPFAGFRNP